MAIARLHVSNLTGKQNFIEKVIDVCTVGRECMPTPSTHQDPWYGTRLRLQFTEVYSASKVFAMYTRGRKDTDASEATHAMWKVCVSNKNVILVCIGVTKECLKTSQ